MKLTAASFCLLALQLHAAPITIGSPSNPVTGFGSGQFGCDLGPGGGVVGASENISGSDGTHSFQFHADFPMQWSCILTEPAPVEAGFSVPLFVNRLAMSSLTIYGQGLLPAADRIDARFTFAVGNGDGYIREYDGGGNLLADITLQTWIWQTFFYPYSIPVRMSGEGWQLVTPEPSAGILLFLGLLGVVGAYSQRRRERKGRRGGHEADYCPEARSSICN